MLAERARAALHEASSQGPEYPSRVPLQDLHSRELTWKPKRVPIRTTVLFKEGYLGFHVSLGECIGDINEFVAIYGV